MPPPATVRVASCAAVVRRTSEAIATASAEPYTRRISCPFIGKGHHPAERGVYIECIMTMDRLSRRDFLQVTTAGRAVAPLRPSVHHPIGPELQAPAVGAGWFDKPMRWVQLTLVENDPGTFDPRFWLDYFLRLAPDAASVTARRV